MKGIEPAPPEMVLSIVTASSVQGERELLQALEILHGFKSASP